MESVYNRASALGMTWICDEDILKYKTKPIDPNTKWSRRSTTSVANGIFDPLGLIAPVVIKGRKLVQEILISTKSWDEQISGELLSEWKKFTGTLPQLDDISIPRFIGIWKPLSLIHI